MLFATEVAAGVFLTIALGGAGLPGTLGWPSLRVRSTIQSIPSCGGEGFCFDLGTIGLAHAWEVRKRSLNSSGRGLFAL